MRRLAAACGIVLLVLVTLHRGREAAAQPAAANGLTVTSHVTYSVQPDSGGLHVDWDVALTDNDLSTAFRYGGYVYYYANYGVPILRGASGVVATGPGGGGLDTELVDQGDSTIVFSKVSFDRELFYGGTYSFHLSYAVSQARVDYDIVTPYYVYVPAVVAGDTATARVVTPEQPGWEVSVQQADCGGAVDGQYVCEASEFIRTAAIVEVFRPGARASLDGKANTPSAGISFSVSYFPGEDEWAAHVRDLTNSALPVLEELFGVPYYQPGSITITEGGQGELYGYAGLYSCADAPCKISISPAADDHTLLHELAHSWTEDFTKRWLEEGFAEQISRVAGPRLNVRLRDEDLPANLVVVFPLDDWGGVRQLIGSDEAARIREASGYQRSRQFIELLERTVGLPAIQQTNIAAHRVGNVDSKKYLDLIEDASGQHLDGIFLDWVFPQDDAQLLRDRRAARDRFASFKQHVTNAGLTSPESLQRAIDAWSFTPANNMMDRADAALYAYAAAKEKVAAPRSLWERFGLQGDHPDGQLRQAAASFESGDYEASVQHGRDAARLIDRADRIALYRALVAGGMAAVAGLVMAFGIVAVRRRMRSRRLTSQL